jgi:hypothetical protein
VLAQHGVGDVAAEEKDVSRREVVQGELEGGEGVEEARVGVDVVEEGGGG